MISINNNPLEQFLSEQQSISILNEFKQAISIHSIYHPNHSRITSRKPYQRKTTITPKQQVFFYYLNLLPMHQTSKFHSFHEVTQQAIQQSFSRKSLSSSNQALAAITKLISQHSTKEA